MDVFLDDDLRQFRDAIVRWVDERLAPRAAAIDEADVFPQELFRELGELGFFSVLYPEKYGGSGISRRYLATYRAAMLADQGLPITTEAALAKLVASENCNKVCQDGFSIFSGYGLMREFPAQGFLRDSFFPMVG